MENLAPIVLFVYNRVEHTKQTVEALLQNDLAEESDLYIYSDGPKDGEERKVERIREYIRTIKGFRNVYIKEREKNWGLAHSIIAGVTEVIDIHGKIIVLEDDLICAKSFLRYMNGGLDKYKSEKKVFSVTGFSFLSSGESKRIPDTYFLSLTSSWTWATWKDRWQYFDEEAKGYGELRWNYKLRKKFNYDNTYDYYLMIKNQMRKNTVWTKLLGKKPIDSWAIRWYWSVFKQGGLTLYPRETLVINEGFDGSGTHCDASGDKQFVRENFGVEKYDMVYEDVIEEKKWIRERVKKALKR